MRRTFFATASATALSLGLMAATPSLVSAQGVQMLQDSVTQSLAQLGVDTSSVDMLTLRQLQQIELVTGGGGSNTEQRNDIEEIMSDASMMSGGAMSSGTMAAGTASGGMMSMPDMTGLEASVKSDLAQLNIPGEVNVQALTVEQLSQVQLVMNSSDTDQVKRGQVEKILGIN